VLMGSDDVADVAVVGEGATLVRREAVAHVVPASGRTRRPGGAQELVRSKLARFAVPRDGAPRRARRATRRGRS
jgi:acyl-coenzyme A synthetase/AMP-(fatty) acid ligase